MVDLAILVLSMAAAGAAAADADIRAVAALAGEPRVVSAAGVHKDETPVATIENPDAFDPAAKQRRLVLVGSANGDSADAVLGAVRWFKTQAPRALKQQWTVSALPAASFDATDKLSLSRWITFQAPDLLVTVGTDLLQAPMDAIALTTADLIPSLQKAMAAARERSSLRQTLLARIQREPLAIAGVLAARYPETPSISYIPSLAWVQTLRLADITRDDALREKVRQQTRPWIAGERPLFPPPQASARPGADRVQLTAVAGTMIFAELAAATGSSSSERDAAARLASDGATLAAKEKAPATPEYGQGWTDDMFMATAILARTSGSPGHEHDLDTAARLLVEYAARLQRPDGLFNHATDGPAAWGRGNGFAALGLMETLSRLPVPHPSRAKLLEILRRQMTAVRANQAPDGAFRQIIDEPGAFREETATAMLLSVMARGVRLGWLDRSYVPTVQRAWRALSAHVTDDGALIDVCAGTGAGPSRRYYFDRPATTGGDDRGGAMALLGALEIYELTKMWNSVRH
jgi:unsaturated rhamnogalacturonyl hydrolase